MGINIDVNIERIDNGFIVECNDSKKNRRFYPTLEKFFNAALIEDIKEIDEDYKRSNSSGVKFSIKVQADT